MQPNQGGLGGGWPGSGWPGQNQQQQQQQQQPNSAFMQQQNLNNNNMMNPGGPNNSMNMNNNNTMSMNPIQGQQGQPGPQGGPGPQTQSFGGGFGNPIGMNNSNIPIGGGPGGPTTTTSTVTGTAGAAASAVGGFVSSMLGGGSAQQNQAQQNQMTQNMQQQQMNSANQAQQNFNNQQNQQLLQQLNQMNQQSAQKDQQMRQMQEQIQNMQNINNQLNQAKTAMGERDQRDAMQGQRMRELELMLDRERLTRQQLDEDLMKTKSEKNQLMDQVMGMRADQGLGGGGIGGQDSLDNLSKPSKTHAELLKHLNELEDLNRQMDEDNKELLQKIKLLERGDGKAKEISDMREYIDSLEDKLATADHELESLEKENVFLKASLDEKTVQLEAQSQFESEYDLHVTALIEEKDQELRQKDVRVSEMERELSDIRRMVGLSAGASGGTNQNPGGMLQDLSTLLYDRDSEIESLYERVSKLEQTLGERIEQINILERQNSSLLNNPDMDQLQDWVDDLKRDNEEKDGIIYRLETLKREFLDGLGPDVSLNLDGLDGNFEPDVKMWDQKVQELHGQNLTLTRENGELKEELSTFMSEASNVMHENQLLRSWCSIPQERLLDLSEVKLHNKVSSSKAVATQKQLEKEILDLEEERLTLKMKIRSLSALASEKSIIFNNLEADQLLQLEQIAETMRRGKLELPETDNSRVLRKKVEELEAQIKKQDKTVADALQKHINTKIDTVLNVTQDVATLQERSAFLEKENGELRSQLQSLNDQLNSNVNNLVQQPIGPVTTSGQSAQTMLKMAGGLAGLLNKGATATGVTAGGATGAAQSEMQTQLQALQAQQQQQMELLKNKLSTPRSIKGGGANLTPSSSASPGVGDNTATESKKVIPLGKSLLGAASALRKQQEAKARAELEKQQKQLKEQQQELEKQKKSLENAQKQAESAAKEREEAEKQHKEAEKAEKEGRVDAVPGLAASMMKKLSEARKKEEDSKKKMEEEKKKKKLQLRKQMKKTKKRKKKKKKFQQVALVGHLD